MCGRKLYKYNYFRCMESTALLFWIFSLGSFDLLTGKGCWLLRSKRVKEYWPPGGVDNLHSSRYCETPAPISHQPAWPMVEDDGKCSPATHLEGHRSPVPVIKHYGMAWWPHCYGYSWLLKVTENITVKRVDKQMHLPLPLMVAAIQSQPNTFCCLRQTRKWHPLGIVVC